MMSGMSENRSKSKNDGEFEDRDFDDKLREWYERNYPHHSSYPSPKFKRLKIIGLIIIILIIIVGLCIAVVYLTFVCWRLESFHFTVDSEAELNATLLNKLYCDLDAESRINVTNETYFLVLSIPDLNYSIRFDYLFEFTSDYLTNLRIEQHSNVPNITSFESLHHYRHNLSIEFKINSSDPDILNVNIFPPDNIIYGYVWIFKDRSQSLLIRLDEGEVTYESQHHTLLLPYNQKIIVIKESYLTGPFR